MLWPATTGNTTVAKQPLCSLRLLEVVRHDFPRGALGLLCTPKVRQQSVEQLPDILHHQFGAESNSNACDICKMRRWQSVVVEIRLRLWFKSGAATGESL